MQRETVTFKVGANEYVIKAYLTGREARELMRIYMRDESTFSPELIKSSGLTGARFETSKEEAWKLVVVSINGHKDGDRENSADPIAEPFSIVDFILDLPKSQYDEVVAQVDEITKDKKNSEEKKTD